MKFLNNYKLKKNYDLVNRINKITNVGKIVISQKRNNFIVSVTKINGEVIFNQTPGTVGYKKSNRKNIMTYKEVLKIVAHRILKETNLKFFQLVFKGICKGKRIVIGTLMYSNINLFCIHSEIFYPKNGCRPKKQRRL